MNCSYGVVGNAHCFYIKVGSANHRAGKSSFMGIHFEFVRSSLSQSQAVKQRHSLIMH